MKSKHVYKTTECQSTCSCIPGRSPLTSQFFRLTKSNVKSSVKLFAGRPNINNTTTLFSSDLNSINAMKDEEEIQTQNQNQNGRFFMTPQPVTVAAPPPPPPPQQILTLALPIQQPRTTTGGGGGGGREDCWSEGATSTLIDAWGERYLQLSRGNLKQTHWQDVADIVSSREDYMKPPKTDIQCKNRIDTLKKKYKTETAKITSGQGPSQWIFFHRLDRLIHANTPPPKIPPVNLQQWQNSSSDDEAPPSPDSTDSFPPDRKRSKLNSGKRWGNSMRELSKAILEFGEAFERTETSKLRQMVEMEKQRMGFAKDMEVQRMQLLMKTQLELTQLKNGWQK